MSDQLVSYETHLRLLQDPVLGFVCDHRERFIIVSHLRSLHWFGIAVDHRRYSSRRKQCWLFAVIAAGFFRCPMRRLGAISATPSEAIGYSTYTDDNKRLIETILC